jgi:hypothetical protein
LHILESRIKESPEDVAIFTQYDLPVKTNIMGVYSLYEDLNKIIKDNSIDYIEYDNVGSITDVQDFVTDIYNKIN